ncbi:DUF7504 family protein [Haloglomus salinum]|jgi:hypothetical protein|uniref:DUF7504 family protein n=1 Tax=Haloglomus salinum TaxID=2962673 RepID=UPI0020C96785|nr:hypothetical protein [Haloglomus salinum]
MSYRTTALDDGTVAFDQGTSLLVSGSSMDVQERIYDLLSEAGESDETTILISTDRGAPEVVRSLRERDAFDAGRVGFIDCTGRDGPEEAAGAPVRRLGSPGDLTGMSLEFAKLADRFDDAGAGDRIRVGLVSISTLLMYTDVRTAFRFLHVFTSRIRSGGLFGIFAMDPGMHDQQTVNTIRAVFDCEARIADDGDVDLRGSGFVTE